MKLYEEPIASVDNVDPKRIVRSFVKNDHHKWFDKGNLDIDDNQLRDGLNSAIQQYEVWYGDDLRKIVVKDKGKIVGFLIWAIRGIYIDDLDDGETYPVLLSTAIDPEYRNRGLLKMMIERAGLQKPYLVHVSPISPVGLWEKIGCKVVKHMGNGNKIAKCD